MGEDAIGNPADDCERCPLSQTRTRVVYGAGPERTSIVLLGDIPGYYDDITGTPFSGGRTQETLSRLTRDSGISSLYSTFLTKCRADRKSTPREIEECLNWLTIELNSVRPAVLLVAGRQSSRLIYPWADRIPVNVARSTEFIGWKGVAIGVPSIGAAAMNESTYREALGIFRRAKGLADEALG